MILAHDDSVFYTLFTSYYDGSENYSTTETGRLSVIINLIIFCRQKWLSPA
jgi:hypothetical protein